MEQAGAMSPDSIIQGHDDGDRRGVHSVLCRSSADGLRQFALAAGITVTALLDVLGHVLAPISELERKDLSEVSIDLGAVVVLAREVDDARRYRR